jgi:acetyltransferase-like isoleucine patch superfamily enzyme
MTYINYNSMGAANPKFYILEAGKPLENDFSHFSIPVNIQVGENTKTDSSNTFKNFFSKLPLGLKLGSNVTLFRSFIATEENGYIEIGDFSFISNASIACYNRIIIGKYVFIAGGVNIVDTDFHPLDAAQRLVDTIAISTIGDKTKRPLFSSQPVNIEDEVWIGYNATILKGVTVGKGAIVQPGAVVSKDVPPGTVVEGNPAKIISRDEK